MRHGSATDHASFATSIADSSCRAGTLRNKSVVWVSWWRLPFLIGVVHLSSGLVCSSSLCRAESLERKDAHCGNIPASPLESRRRQDSRHEKVGCWTHEGRRELEWCRKDTKPVPRSWPRHIAPQALATLCPGEVFDWRCQGHKGPSSE